MCKKMTYSRFLSCLTLLAAVCGLSRSQPENVDIRNVSMQNVTQQLARRFEELRTVGLGLDALQNEYNRVGFTFSRLDNSEIDALLSNATASQTIASILDLFNTIASSSASPPPSPPPSNCCDASPQSTQSCCHGCEAVPPNLQQLSIIESTFSTSNLSGVELEFGFSGGSILRYPAFQPRNETCSQNIPDARLQPWYIDTIRVRPREVVLLLDSTETDLTPTNAFPTLRSAAKQILDSLTYQDKVGVVVFDVRNHRPLELQVTNRVIPVCQSNKDALANFLDSRNSGGQYANYSRAFTEAYSLFTNDTNSDKLLLFFTHGTTSPHDRLNSTFGEATADTILSTITQRSAETGNNVVISVYYTEQDPSPFRTLFFDRLPMDQRGPLITLITDGRSVTNYYSIFLNDSATSSNTILSHQLDSNGVNSLSISRAFHNGSSLVGVFHAVLPWQQLIGHITPVLEQRRSSYFLVVGGDRRRLLYHPLFPSQLQSNALVTDFESEGQILSVLGMAESQPSSTHRRSVQKLLILPTSRRDYNGLVRREVPSTYHCRAMGTTGAQLYGCVVLADQDIATVVQQGVNVTETYMSGSPYRRPIYHNVRQSVPPESQCDYFCQISASGEISFQLTGANTPAAVQDITRYIEGTGRRPDFVQPGVASETAINSVVAASWLDQSSTPSEYITRRHLVTPSGLYLTYPPLHRVQQFQPLLTEWYTTVAAHTSTLTLTPPRVDPLGEGGRLVVSVGSALRAPADQNDMDLSDGGQLLSVVAADIKFASLRVFVSDALPLCEQDRVSCFIMDDLGRLVYHADLLRSDFQGEPVFFSNQDFQQHWPILIDLLSHGTISKHQCVDLFNSTTRERRFFSINSTRDETYQNLNGNSCSRYLVRHIPGTNAFLAVVESMSQCLNLICFCPALCLNCGTFQRTSCECPCRCQEDCVQPAGVPPCPESVSGDANDRANLSAIIPGGLEVNCGSNCTSQCFDQNCACRAGFDSCNKARDCYWCEQEEKCVHYTECCSFEDSNACCGAPPQTERFSFSPECLLAKCLRDPDGPDAVCNTTTPSPNPDGPDAVCNTTTPTPTEQPSADAGAVVAGVVGGLVGLLLLLVFLGFILWYQFCRIKEPEDEASPVSAFDFSGKRVESVNPAASTNELGEDEDVKNPDYAKSKDTTL